MHDLARIGSIIFSQQNPFIPNNLQILKLKTRPLVKYQHTKMRYGNVKLLTFTI